MSEVEADATRAEPGEGASGRGSDPFIGRVLNDRFHILKRIARGGMGSVYFATQAPLSRAVAVKVLHVFRGDDAEPEETFRRRFLQEASILAKLQHPNIVMLLDYGPIVGSDGEDYFMAMEFLRGETLAQRFKAQGRLTVAESISLARQIGRGLREAHRCGFIHRDLKPSNIMLVPDDEGSDIVKLVDFGIGKVLPGGPEPVRHAVDETRAGILLGSPRYMAPEQIRSEPVEPRTDLYGLGVILFQALTGEVPFDGPSFDVLLSHCLSRPPRLSDRCPEQACPESLSRLVESLLEKEVRARPTVDEFLRRLAVVEEETTGAPAAGAPTEAARRSDTPPDTRPPNRWAVPAIALGALVLLVLASLVARPNPAALAGAAAPSGASDASGATGATAQTAAGARGLASESAPAAASPPRTPAPAASSTPPFDEGERTGIDPADAGPALAARAALEPASSIHGGGPSSSRAGAPARSRAPHNPASQMVDVTRTDGNGLEIRLRR